MDKLSTKQLKILAFANSDYDALICDGAIRAGKTSIMSIAFILWSMREFSGVNFGICSKTIGTAERNIILPLLSTQYIRNKYKVKYSRGRYLAVSNGKKTNMFYLFGGKDESSYQLIQGITLAGVLLDEVALMPRSFVEQALARCSVDGSKFWFNCNPAGPLHWFNQEWVENAEAHNALRLHFTMDDNPSISAKIRERYESMYTGVFYRRYILGEWCTADGLVYDMFDNEKNVVNDYGPEMFEGDSYVSCDFGIQNPTTFLLWRRLRESRKWVCVDEWYYSGREKGRQKTVAELVAGLKVLLARNGNVIPKQVIIDPSASALIEEVRRNGFHARAAVNDVLDGIEDVQYMLNTGELLFCKKCKSTIGEFGMYVWDEKASLRGEDKPVKEHDHCMDAVRYFVNTLGLVKKHSKKMYNSVFER